MVSDFTDTNSKLTNPSTGVIADIWDAVGRGQATSVFTACVFIGPVLGPIVGGYIVDSALGWCWVFWVMMIFAGVCTLITVAALPETYAPVILAKKAEQIRKAGTEKAVYAEHEKQDWSVRGVIHRTIYRPFEMLFKEPILILVTVYITSFTVSSTDVSNMPSVLWTLTNVPSLVFEALPVIFVDKRGFTIAQVGLVFIGVSIGSTMCWISSAPSYRARTIASEAVESEWWCRCSARSCARHKYASYVVFVLSIVYMVPGSARGPYPIVSRSVLKLYHPAASPQSILQSLR